MAGNGDGVLARWRESFGQFEDDVLALMQARGWNQRTLAKGLDCHEASVSRWWTERRLPRAVFLHKLARMVAAGPGKSLGARHRAGRKAPAPLQGRR